MRICTQPDTRLSPRYAARRHGFTLVELLVVVGIILVIAGLTAFFMPGFELRQRADAGASRLQNFFMVAKQRALLDRAPRGVRLFPDVEHAFTLRKAQFIGQPDDFSGGEVFSNPFLPNPNILLIPTQNVVVKLPNSPNPVPIAGADLTGGYNDPNLWPVQTGDYLQLHNAGLMHQIQVLPNQPFLDDKGKQVVDVITNQPVFVHQILLASPLSSLVTVPTKNYRIVRTPRVLGDESLEMPASVGADIWTNIFYGQPLPNLIQGKVEDANPTNAAFKGPAGFPADNNIFAGSVLAFAKPIDPTTFRQPMGEAREIATYDGATKTFTFAQGFSLPPQNGDVFYIIRPLDILFSPSGAVMGPASSNPRIIFWVRDVGFESEFQGEPSLIVLYTRSGLANSYDVVPDPQNPYLKVR